MRRLAAGLTFLLAGCATPPPAPPAPPGIVARTADVSFAALPAAAVDRWTGSFHSGALTLEIARSGDGLVASRGSGVQTLRFIGLGTFTDAAGTSYLFDPPDGSAGVVTVDAAGTRRSWAR